MDPRVKALIERAQNLTDDDRRAISKAWRDSDARDRVQLRQAGFDAIKAGGREPDFIEATDRVSHFAMTDAVRAAPHDPAAVPDNLSDLVAIADDVRDAMTSALLGYLGTKQIGEDRASVLTKPWRESERT